MVAKVTNISNQLQDEATYTFTVDGVSVGTDVRQQSFTGYVEYTFTNVQDESEYGVEVSYG